MRWNFIGRSHEEIVEYRLRWGQPRRAVRRDDGISWCDFALAGAAVAERNSQAATSARGRLLSSRLPR
jgi:hypothetical protein